MPYNRDYVAIGLAIVLSLTLKDMPNHYQLAIAEYGNSAMLTTGQHLFSSVISSARNEERSRFLLARNVELALENMRIREDKLENSRLRRALEFKESQGQEKRLVAAEVIGRDADLIFDTITINAGKDRGIEKNGTVVTSDGLLVGHVTQVQDRTATVQLIRRSQVSAVIQEGRGKGIVSWEHGNRFRLRYIEANAVNRSIRKGDRVVSSGLGGRFPKGIPIGEITEVYDQERDPLFKAVFLQSGVDFSGIEEVFVMPPNSA